MTKLEMEKFWQTIYPLCPPINHLFKIFYTDRWLRIHSQPDSKRYAETDDEWETLLNTQNNILDDVFNDNEKFYLFTGSLSSNTFNIVEGSEIKHQCLQNFKFSAMELVDLHAVTKEYYAEDIFYTPVFTALQYTSKGYNNILKSIANDELRVFFLNPKTKTIFAPYNGGVDIIYANTEIKNEYKLKYNHFAQQDQYK
jgi:hypothetical protein